MSDAFHHGPEIIERDTGAGVVREVKSAVTFIVGAAPIHLLHDTAGKRAAYINRRIVIRSVQDAAAAFGPPTAGYSLPEAISAIFAKVENGRGGGTIIAVNVFDPDTHKDVDGAPDPTAITAGNIIGAVDGGGNASGFQLAYGAFNELGYFPKILLAPRYSALTGVRPAMETVAGKIHAVHLNDLPLGLTVQQAVASRGASGDYNTASERALLLYPHLKAYDPVIDDLALQPYSQHLAGVMVASDLAYGYHESPSNREMTDILGIERDISFYPGDYQSQTNDLNAAGIITAMNYYGSGYRTWGNRSAAYPTATTARNFVHVRRTLDQIHESALYYLMSRTDRTSGPANLEFVEEDINAFLRKKEGDGALYSGSRFRFNRDKTTSRDVTDGRVYYRLDCMPVGVMERLTIESYLDTSIAGNALGLSA